MCKAVRAQAEKGVKALPVRGWRLAVQRAFHTLLIDMQATRSGKLGLVMLPNGSLNSLTVHVSVYLAWYRPLEKRTHSIPILLYRPTLCVVLRMFCCDG